MNGIKRASNVINIKKKKKNMYEIENVSKYIYKTYIHRVPVDWVFKQI